MADDEVELLLCDLCQSWHPQDHADAERLGQVAYTSHMLTEHPTHPIAALLDGLMLGEILGGTIDA